MKDEISHLVDRLQDLERRVSVRTNDPNERPVWVHWSDTQILRTAIDILKAQDQQIARVREALGIAINEVTKR